MSMWGHCVYAMFQQCVCECIVFMLCSNNEHVSTLCLCYVPTMSMWVHCVYTMVQQWVCECIVFMLCPKNDYVSALCLYYAQRIVLMKLQRNICWWFIYFAMTENFDPRFGADWLKIINLKKSHFLIREWFSGDDRKK